MGRPLGHLTSSEESRSRPDPRPNGVVCDPLWEPGEAEQNVARVPKGKESGFVRLGTLVKGVEDAGFFP